MNKISRNAAEHYKWKGICDGWYFVKRDDVSIIAEKMPPHTAEDMHYHTQSRQFFYVLSGEAVMKLPENEVSLCAGEGIEIPLGTPHQMTNRAYSELQFLVVSAPKSHGDKIIIS
ncbi:cupin domain protein [[Clostridium] methylpentosum DSM 5476]|uniref:Cupin domain protein n=1 Tax=[Clostridium] methylpentosum DSM 5476 TaxID=537013 RepID=C0EFB3_9FIRM|nr:cupin domain protein [[Clostridium] methylpentosum DSM 5476]